MEIFMQILFGLTLCVLFGFTMGLIDVLYNQRKTRKEREEREKWTRM